ncbi:hypothetical protein LIA77_05102 [Sarocladium implicatum]|nr:hypothetical protein LIA77_05102 [Sarocladium implicatum]
MVLDKILSHGIGLASEAIQHSKNKKEKKHQDELAFREASLTTLNTPQEPPITPKSRASPQPSASGPLPSSQPPPFDRTESEQDIASRPIEETFWELDESQAEFALASGAFEPGVPVATIPKGVANEPPSVDALVDAFLAAHKPKLRDGPAEMPYAVILPQRRPTARSRGFIRAYAPCLETSCGIGEDEFMQFHDFYAESMKFSNALKIVKVTVGVAGLIPSPIIMATTTAVGALAEAAGSMQSRGRSNDFLTAMNAEYFMPQGLICCIMRYEPREDKAGSTPQETIAKATAEGWSASSNHGSMGEAMMPIAAPLVFPERTKSNSAAREGKEADGGKEQDAAKKASSMSRMTGFFNDYMDRRARAEFAAKAPDSQLTSAMADKTVFESSWGDPVKLKKYMPPMPIEYITRPLRKNGNAMKGHPTPIKNLANKIKAKSKGEEVQKGPQRTDSNQSEKRDKREGGFQMPIKGMMKQHVLYMMILPLPSREQIEAVERDPNLMVEMEEVRM